MSAVRLFALASAGILLVSSARAQYFATEVISYTPGTGAHADYNDPNQALGAPTVFIGYQDADPFNSPYQPAHLVALGEGGSLILRFDQPIYNAPGNPFGLDFIVFGHAGFAITNGDFSGGGITDGSLFAGGTAEVRVSVSVDGITFYTLDPMLAPAVDGLYPTDASGNPFLPVNPALTAADFAGKTLAEIRALYAGSAGGAGFDLSWALDEANQSVALTAVQYVRFDNLSGAAYLDAVSVVPEPAAGALFAVAAVLFGLRRTRS
ncbi:MAG TPA: PEP-CTERM sorting domain-containing protein [Verrucomicrobia bacterium]|nr:PEP-CTERM sorting domain-containing protein [Verrucomicrobiota bacterium]HPU55278.1 PEP-CTERM sorting domain-containing protein [Verrucomicrobiota bacterium]